MMGFAGQLSLGHAIYVGLGAYMAAALFTRFGIGPWLGLLAAMPVAAACGAIIGFLAFRFGVAGVYFAILTIAFAEFARIGFDHLDFVNASGGLVPAGRAIRPQRSVAAARQPDDVLLRDPGRDGAGVHAVASVAAQPHRLFLARHPRGRAGGARRRHRYLPLQDVRGDDLGGGHLVRRRVLRVLLQQSVSRAGVQHFPLDRDDSRADHRRRRHAVRTDPRRLRAHRACRSRSPRRCRRSASICPAPSRCFTGFACCSWSWRCRKAFGRGWRAGSASRSAADERAALARPCQQALPRPRRRRCASASTCPRA